MGLSGEREGRPGQAACPVPLWSELDYERGGGAPLSFSLSLSFLPPLSLLWKPTRTWSPSRIPLLGARHRGTAGLPLAPLYMRAGGTLETQQLIYLIF